MTISDRTVPVMDSMDRALTWTVEMVDGRAECTIWRDGFDRYPAFRFSLTADGCATLAEAIARASRELRGQL